MEKNSQVAKQHDDLSVEEKNQVGDIHKNIVYLFRCLLILVLKQNPMKHIFGQYSAMSSNTTYTFGSKSLPQVISWFEKIKVFFINCGRHLWIPLYATGKWGLSIRPTVRRAIGLKALVFWMLSQLASELHLLTTLLLKSVRILWKHVDLNPMSRFCHN